MASDEPAGGVAVRVEATVGSAPKRGGLDVIEIVAEYLDREGYDGLYSSCGDCACKTDDLAPCGEIHGDCAAGYLQPCPPDCGEHDWHIGADKPNAGNNLRESRRDGRQVD